MYSVASGCKGHKFMEREDPWCETGNMVNLEMVKLKNQMFALIDAIGPMIR
jgi:hypothetical protein